MISMKKKNLENIVSNFLNREPTFLFDSWTQKDCSVLSVMSYHEKKIVVILPSSFANKK
jgi:hypothetical protein